MEVLIKDIVQAIPTYLQAFVGPRQTHWLFIVCVLVGLQGGKMSQLLGHVGQYDKAQVFGDLRFINIKLFNLAMLTHQAWLNL
jgi:hypothetical protein